MQKQLDKNDLKYVQLYTKNYKRIEACLFKKIYVIFHKCEQCQRPYCIYEDMLENKEILKKFYQSEIQKIIENRKACNQIFIDNQQTNSSIHRHQYVVDIYEKILL